MLVSACIAFTGCGDEYIEDYKGPVIPVYFSEIPTTFDPHLAYLDNTALPVLSLMYEGLYKYDGEGNVVEGLADGYEWIENDDETGSYIIEITIRETRWSDQVTVKADDFVYAWRRLVDPANPSPAASMLYMIDNAYEARNAVGEVTKYDLGALAVDTNTLRITFAEKPNMDLFMEYLASPALVPLRDTAINKTGDNDWASQSAIVVSNGPFYLKNFNIEDTSSDDEELVMRLERNRYYKRCVIEDEEDPVDEYVLPYRLDFIFGGNAKTASTLGYDSYVKGDVLVNALLPIAKRSGEKSKANAVGTMSTHTYIFNTDNELFSKPEVRNALSLAIDRKALAELVVFATPAKGIVPDGVFETLNTDEDKTTFRSKGGTLIKESANLTEAKALLKKAGVNLNTPFTITVKATDEVAIASAEFCVKAWKQLGFKNVSVRQLGYYVYDDVNTVNANDPKYDPEASEYENLVFDLYTACYLAGGKDVVIPERKLKLIKKIDPEKNADLLKGFDIIAVDMQQMSVDAFATLAGFATYFNGGVIDLGSYNKGDSQDDNAPIAADHVSGYTSAAYDKLIKQAYAEKDLTKRAAILHKAEKALIADMPVMPLFVYQNGYLISNKLTEVTYGWGGTIEFSTIEFPDYVEPEE